MTIPNAHYNEKMASVYDQMYPIQFDTDLAVEFLAGLCPAGGRLLELGVGTGRLALPLARRGFEVHGIDGSEAMLSKLKENDPDGLVRARHGDFTREGTGLTFSLITLMLNTFFVAVTKEEQLGCLGNVRDQLTPDGRFVLEAFDPAPFHAMQRPDFSMRYLNEHAVMLDTVAVDRSQQLMIGAHTIIDGGPPETTRHVLRYAFPREIDLLAEMSGLRLLDRWDGWTGHPYTALSPRHVSVYGRVDSA